MSASFPLHLRRLSDRQAQRLCRLLWSWDVCTACAAENKCSDPQCPVRRLPRLAHFTRHYDETCLLLELDLGSRCSEVTPRHDNVFAAIAILFGSVDQTRQQIREELQAKNALGRTTSGPECDLVINSIVEITTMINCTSQYMPLQLLEHGLRQISWHDDMTYAEFIDAAFPRSGLPVLDQKLDECRGILCGRLTARKLVKHAGISLKPTSDIRNHLAYDQRSNSLSIFFHIAFLKEQLRITNGLHLPDAKCLERGALPRQMVLEILDSIQKVLFPLVEPRSKRLLSLFVAKNRLDPDCLNFESTGLRANDELNISYYYFGNQLLDLYEVLRNPRPQKPFDKWLERRSGARYIMLATLAGIVFAIFLGMATLAVSIFQTYLTYQAWKHPVR